MAATLSTFGGNSLEVGTPGQVADLSVGSVIDSKINENATAIDYGCAVARGASDDTIKPFTSYAFEIVGISVASPLRPSSAAAGATPVVTYAQRDIVPVMKSGFMFVTAAENVTRGDNVIAITSGSGTLGGTTGGVANGTTRKTIKGARWETTTTSGSIGKIFLAGVGAIDLTT